MLKIILVLKTLDKQKKREMNKRIDLQSKYEKYFKLMSLAYFLKSD